MCKTHLKFSRADLCTFSSPEGMIDYAMKRLLHVGGGSGREVFLLSQNSVLKIAKSYQGRQQNKKEVLIGTNPDFAGKVVTKVLGHAPDGFSWIISELACVFRREEEFDEHILTMREYTNLLRWMERAKSLEDAIITMFKRELLKMSDNSEYFEITSKHPFLLMVFELMREYNLLLPDMDRFEHYGKTIDGRVLLLDYGT